jgi:hypothetical protein
MALSDTKLLLHCNGTDGSTSFSDSSLSNHTVTANGDAQVDTAIAKWGGALSLAAIGDYLSIPNHADWDMNGTNYTIDFWIKFTDALSAAKSYRPLAQVEDSNNGWWLSVHGGTYRLTFVIETNNVAVLTFQTESFLDPSDWQHVALIKVSNEYGIYFDGTQVGYVDDATTDTFTGSLTVGSGGVTYNTPPARMDEIRISKANPFGAAPNSGKTDTITTPIGPHWMSQINIGDAWKVVDSVQINIGDVWKPVVDMKINIGDAWKDLK